MSGQARKDEAFRLAQSLQQQSSFFTKRGESERNTQASYAVSKLIAEKMMPYRRRIREEMFDGGGRHSLS